MLCSILKLLYFCYINQDTEIILYPGYPFLSFPFACLYGYICVEMSVVSILKPNLINLLRGSPTLETELDRTPTSKFFGINNPITRHIKSCTNSRQFE